MCQMLNALCRVISCVVIVAFTIAIFVVIFLVRGQRGSTETEEDERNEATNAEAALATAFSLLKMATFWSGDGSSVAGTLSLVGRSNGARSLLAVNGLSFASDCEELEVRLLGAWSTLFDADDVVLVVPVTADVNATADFTETLDEEFDVEFYDQAVLWCTTSSGAEEQLGDTADLETPTILEGGDVLIKQATLSGSDYTLAEGLVQIAGSVAVVDDILVTTYYLRFEDIEVSFKPDVYMYLTTGEDEPEDVNAEGSLRVEVEGTERGTFSVNGTYNQAVPDEFVSPEEYVAAVVWRDTLDVYIGSGLFVDM